MGIDSSSCYFSDGTLDTLSDSNEFLDDYFTKIKNYNNVITRDIFYYKIMQCSTSKAISDKIFKLFSSGDKMSFRDFRFFYCAFYSLDTEAKIRLISLLLFKTNQKITFTKYAKRLKYFFNTSTYFYPLLSNEEFLRMVIVEEYGERQMYKGTFEYKLREMYKGPLENFIFLKQYTNYDNTKYEFICSCENDSENGKKVETNCLYVGMKEKFNEIQKKNGNIFPLKIFNDLMKECNISDGVCKYMIKYLENKMNKNFIDFETFYNFVMNFRKLQQLHNNELLKLIFDILSYPNKVISKQELTTLYYEITNKNIILNQDTKKILNSLPNTITMDIFMQNAEYLTDIQSNFLNIIVLPYKCFNQNPENKEIEFYMINNFLNSNETLHLLLKQSLSKEKTYYCIPVTFWENYKEYLSFLSSGGTPCGIERPALDTIGLSNEKERDKLNFNMIYLKDYYIVPSSLYVFIKKMCGLHGSDIKVSLIKYDKKFYKDEAICNSEFGLDENESTLKFESEDKTSIYEIELHPINVYYIWFNNNSKEYSIESLESIQNYLNKKEENLKEKCVYSKITLLNEIKQKMIAHYKINEYDECEMYLYYNGKFTKEDILVKDQHLLSLNVKDECVCVLETKNEKDEFSLDKIINHQKVDKEIKVVKNKENKINIPNIDLSQYKQNKAFFGIKNIKNNCYINSVLQTMFNNQELKEFFLSRFFQEFLQTILNSTSPYASVKFYELADIQNKKSQEEEGNFILRPNYFLQTIYAINSRFGQENQEDAGEFLQFFIERINKETQLFSIYKYILDQNNGAPNTTKQKSIISNSSKLSDDDKGKMYIAKEISQNCSFINALYCFILKSNIQCKVCGDIAVTYEKCRNIDVPIPSVKFITTRVIFHPLHKALRIYNKEGNSEFNGSIPIRIDISIETDKRMKDVLDVIKGLNKIDLEKEKVEEEKKNDDINSLTTYLIYNHDYKQFISLDQLVKYSFINNTTVHIYQVLNSNGIKQFNEEHFHQENRENTIRLLPSLPVIPPETVLNQNIVHIVSYEPKNKIPAYINSVFEIRRKEPYFYEYPIIIKHRYVNILYPYLFNKYNFVSLNLCDDFILVNNSNQTFNLLALYDYMLIKFTYLLALTSSTSGSPWWKEGSKIKKCYPFILKVVNKDTNSCALCPWFQFCKGCSLIPREKNQYVTLRPNNAIVIEWCSELIKKEFIKENIRLELDYDKGNVINAITSQEILNSKSIELDLNTCLEGFFQKESLDNKIFCNHCNQLQYKIKYYSIYTMPKYLTLTLKRFFSFDMGMDINSKNESFISYPIENFQLDNNPIKYDLFAVINHIGNVNAGHYYSYVKVNDEWLCYNDTKVTKISTKEIVTNRAYILIYKENGKNREEDFMFYNYMRMLLNLNNNYYNFGGDDFLFEGEPVWADKTYGFVKSTKFEKDQFMVDIQFEDINEKYRGDVVKRDISISHTLQVNLQTREKELKKKDCMLI